MNAWLFRCVFLLVSVSACVNSPDAVSPQASGPFIPASISERIVFVSDQGTSLLRQIYVMRSDGSERTRITQSSIDFIDPAFSPDGLTILATSHTADSSDEIYLMNLDGSNLVNVSNAPGDDRFASFSPDGSKILFTSMRDGNSEIYIMDSNGQHQIRLTSNEVNDHSPQFTPDGSRIVFCSSTPDRSGRFPYDVAVNSYDIYVMLLDGSGKKCLTTEQSCFASSSYLNRNTFNVRDLEPGISSDGSRIVFTSYMPESIFDHRLYIMDSGGETCKRLVSGDVVAPTFAPGNAKILLRSHGDGKHDLYEMDLDGTHFTKLTRGTPGHVIFAQCSPDGFRILFTTDDGTYRHVWVMNRDGSAQTQLTFGDGNDTYPRYQPVRGVK